MITARDVLPATAENRQHNLILFAEHCARERVAARYATPPAKQSNPSSSTAKKRTYQTAVGPGFRDMEASKVDSKPLLRWWVQRDLATVTPSLPDSYTSPESSEPGVLHISPSDGTVRSRRTRGCPFPTGG